MSIKTVPYALAVCCAFGLYSVSANAQTPDARSRQINPVTPATEVSCLNDDPVIISVAEIEASSTEELKSTSSLILSASSGLAKYQPSLFQAIDARLGAHYHWGSTGPNVFDCSGFVWATFHSVGIDFERGSARTLWARFEAPAPGEQYKFGTLVFFTHLTHVGIVADEHGFYHASRHHGVVYAPFNDYWLSRIDGFRRVPLPVQQQRTD
jgi:cell wall-associated NlpC family hydrolase